VSEAKDYSPEEIADALDHYQATTITVHNDIDVRHTVVEFSEAEPLFPPCHRISNSVPSLPFQLDDANPAATVRFATA